MEQQRSFATLYKYNDNISIFGRYTGYSAKQAAYKSFDTLYKLYTKNNIDITNKELMFGLCETTRNKENKKIYWFIGIIIIIENGDGINIKLYGYIDTNGNKHYYSKHKIEELCGFEKLFGNKEENIKAKIHYPEINVNIKICNDTSYIDLYEKAKEENLFKHYNFQNASLEEMIEDEKIFSEQY